MDIRVKMDSRGLKDFSEAMAKQVPFATAVALTRTAVQARDKVREDLPRHFTLRNQFTKNGIRYLRAKKRDWPNARSEVGSVSDYMALQEEGGSKTPGDRAFAIPKGIRTSENKVVSRARWPGKILAPDTRIPGGGRPKGSVNGKRSKPTPFILTESAGAGVYVRARRRGRALKRLYRLTRRTLHVRSRDWLQEPVIDCARKNLEANFVKALDEAMRPRG